MIILKDKPGQLCNRLWAFAPFIALAFEKGKIILVPHLAEYLHFFERTEQNGTVVFLESSQKSILKGLEILQKLLRRIPLSLRNYFHISVDKPIDPAYLKSKAGLYFIDSWTNSKPNELMQKYRKELSNLFAPKASSRSKVDIEFESWNVEYITIVGVHMRRGDYKEYRNGIYYYSNGEYLGVLEKLKSNFSDPDKVAFFVASNEDVSTKDFPEIKMVKLENPNPVEDLYALSKCDYILGPPSTFSMWASYIGHKPLLFLKSLNQSLELQNFSEVIYQNHFKNGNIFTH